MLTTRPPKSSYVPLNVLVRIPGWESLLYIHEQHDLNYAPSTGCMKCILHTANSNSRNSNRQCSLLSKEKSNYPDFLLIRMACRYNETG